MNPESINHLWASGLVGRFAAYVMTFSSIIAISITAVELRREYSLDLTRIQERMQQIETTYLDSVAENVWVADKAQLSNLLQGIVRLPDIVLVEIRVNDELEIRRRASVPAAIDMTQSFHLHHLHQGKVQVIGQLVVSATHENAYQRVLDKLLFLLVMNGIKTALVAGFIIFVFYRLVGRHLRDMARYASERANLNDASPFVLKRARPDREDELTWLSRAMNYLRGELVRLANQEAQRASQLAQELNARKRAEEKLSLMARVFESSREAILITDAQNRIVATNTAFSRLTGYLSEDVLGQNPRILSSGETNPEVYRQMWADLNHKDFWQGEVWDRRKDGHTYPKWLSISVVRDDSERVVNYIAIFSDITQRKLAEEKIFRLAHYDSLTNLPNRLMLGLTLTQAIDQARAHQNMLAVVFIDLDRFKDINDVFGHDVGDQLLVQTANRLTDTVRDSDTVGRLGGDEFVVLLRSLPDVETAMRVVEKIQETLDQSYSLAGKALRSSPSIGLAVYPDDGASTEMLMKNADVAMYHAKALGRNNAQRYIVGMEQVTRERIKVTGELRQALELRQFELHYQPQFDGRTGRLVGMEALVRWHHPENGLTAPDRFIPLAEETGLILPLGEWILDEACRQIRVWRDQHGVHLDTIAVNLSAHQLNSSALIDFIIYTLGKYALEAGSLELEITESMLMENIDANIEKLRTLRGMGVKLSIDDFGTGYSSLSYLKLLPIDALKLDRTFVKDLETDASNAAICRSTIALAHNLGLKVIAEGVETQAQRDFLLLHDCDALQGYLLGKPMPAGRALDVLTSQLERY